MEFIAHIDNLGEREQSYKTHSDNCSLLCENYGERIGFKSAAKLIGSIHDVGKLTDVFQKYIRKENNAKRGEINHSSAGARYVFENYPLNSNSLQSMLSQIISVVVTSHHGIIDVLTTDGDDKFKKRLYPKKEIYYKEVLENSDLNKEELDKLFAESLEEMKNFILKLKSLYKNLKATKEINCRNRAMHFSLSLLTRFLLSCIIDADRYDSACFAENKEIQLPKSNNKLWQKLSFRLDDYLDAFSTEKLINKYRAEISLACKNAVDYQNGVFQLSVPTGAGKTFASMRFALHNAKKFNKDRIIYVSPYRTILEQNAHEYRTILQKENEDYILEHHSDVVEDSEEYKLHTERWDSPIILTTAVQFLNTLFLGKSNSIRRFHAMANSVIILDEVQSIPTQMTSMFTLALNFLARICNCTVLLCTATQPDYFSGDYPLFLSENPVITPNLDEIFSAFKRTQIIDYSSKPPFNKETLSEFIINQNQTENHILAILNTKGSVALLVKELKERFINTLPDEQPKILYLTTNLCPAHRMKIIAEIKKYPRDKKLICVSTNLIESGVDFSFNCVIRALAGLDNIVQSAGRCNRNNECTKNGKVFIIKFEPEYITSMKELQKAQKTTTEFLQAFLINPNLYSNDLISPKALEEYYKRLFSNSKDILDYPVEKGTNGLYKSTTLLDLLSVNSMANLARLEEGKPQLNYPLTQAFKTAGNIFEVINSYGQDVIVPYNDEGRSYITQLNFIPHESDTSTIVAIIRKVQRYTVSVSDTLFKKLMESGGVKKLPTGVVELKSEFYSDVYGVTSEFSCLEDNIF